MSDISFWRFLTSLQSCLLIYVGVILFSCFSQNLVMDGVLTNITGYILRSLLTHCKSICITELGDGWNPAILESQDEYDFLIETWGLFISSYDQLSFIGGSVCFLDYRLYGLSNYKTDESGNRTY